MTKGERERGREREFGLDAVLRPRAVAIVGASRDPAKRGHQIVRALIQSGYCGAIIPVNPGGGELLGLPVITSLRDATPMPDLAVVCTPARTVPAVLGECAEAGVAAAVVLAVGFGESGDAGRRLEAEVAAVAARTGIRVVGPNTSGLLNVPLGLNLIGMRGVRAGPLALLVQSGNLALQLVTECSARSSTGFTYVVGVGNEIDLRFHEYLDDLARDDATRAILVHAEGFRDGRAFLGAAARAAARKPVVLLKGARSAAGGETAKSHTGAVAGEYDVLRAALRQAGVVEVTRTDELLHVGETLASQPPLAPGQGIAVLSDGGGHAALAVDALAGLSGSPPAATSLLSEETQERLRKLLGPAAAVRNPIDLAGAADADPRVFAQAAAILAADKSVGAILVVGLFGGYAIRFSQGLLDAETEAARGLAEAAKRARAALVVHSLYAATRSAPLSVLSDAGVPVVESLEVACRCVAALVERRELARRGAGWPGGVSGHEQAPLEDALRSRLPGSQVAPPEWDALHSGFVASLGRARVGDQDVLLETEARALVERFGVDVAPAVFCRTPAEAAEAALSFDGPLALKAVSPAALHKTEAGAVALRVAPEEVRAAFERLVRNVALVRGVLIGPMLPPPVAELLAGVRRDPQFGLVLAIAAGGTLVELLGDVALRVLPIGEDDVREMLSELRMARLLRGVRGGPPAAVDAFARLVLALTRCASSIPDLDAIELNPIFVYPDEAVAIDARVVFARRPG